MIFTQDYESYGVKFKVRLLSAKEVMDLTEQTGEEDTFKVVMNVTLDEKLKPLFATIDEVKASLPPKCIEDIVSLCIGNELKKK